jgi:hypothetical protein
MNWLPVLIIAIVVIGLFLIIKKKNSGGETEDVEGKINRALIQEDGNKVFIQLFVATTYNEDLKCFFNTAKDKAPTKEDLKNRDQVILKGRWDQSSTPYTFKIREIENKTQNKSFKA